MALESNRLASESEIIIYADGAKHQRDDEAVQEVRKVIRGISGFRQSTIVERDRNFGLGRNIIEGVSEVLQRYDSVIVLEDDMVTSPYFLSYMNDALERYASDDRVISIHGYLYPLNISTPEAFFLPGADCWGWATWQRGWSLFNPNGSLLLKEIKKRGLKRKFDYDGSYPYTRMLEAQIAGLNNSWAIRWYASAFLNDKLTLYPGRSLVHNIGNDASGTHCEQSSAMNVTLSDTYINLEGVTVRADSTMRQEFSRFFRRQGRSGFMANIRRLLNF
jgi:Glycosyl transferase family 2